MTDATSGAGIAYLSGGPEFTHFSSEVLVAQSLSFLCSILSDIVYLFGFI